MANDLSSEAVVPIDPSWPKMSFADATAVLTAAGAPFEMESVAIGGVATRGWKNAPHEFP